MKIIVQLLPGLNIRSETAPDLALLLPRLNIESRTAPDLVLLLPRLNIESVTAPDLALLRNNGSIPRSIHFIFLVILLPQPSAG